MNPQRELHHLEAKLRSQRENIVKESGEKIVARYTEREPCKANHLCPVSATGIPPIVEWLTAVFVLQVALLSLPVSMDNF